jgi:hypothetical protein
VVAPVKPGVGIPKVLFGVGRKIGGGEQASVIGVGRWGNGRESQQEQRCGGGQKPLQAGRN